MEETYPLWGFHIYASGDTFVKEGRIALGWSEMGDLSSISPTREAFKAKVREIYGDQSHVTNSAGQLFRFVTEMKSGDIVLYRSKVGPRFILER
jgi:restriction system protein